MKNDPYATQDARNDLGATANKTIYHSYHKSNDQTTPVVPYTEEPSADPPKITDNFVVQELKIP